MPLYDSEPVFSHSCLNSSRPDGFASSGMWQEWIPRVTSPELSKCPSDGSPEIGGVPLDVHVVPGYAPWKLIFSLITLAWTQRGDSLKTEVVGSISWKQLRSSSGHARDDDDDDRLYRQFMLTINLVCILRKSVNYIVLIFFSNRNNVVNSDTVENPKRHFRARNRVIWAITR